MPTRRNWTCEEHLLAFHLYCRLPFGRLHARTPEIRDLANRVGRTANAVTLKLTNFARLDPTLQARGIRGIPHGAKGEEEIWEEFAGDPEALTFEAKRVAAEREGQPLLEEGRDELAEIPPGEEMEALVKRRGNQQFFRRRVFAAYEHRCCVTGLRAPELLVASHIVPLAEDPANRLDPRNGLCLNALHDRAFDRHLMWIDDDRRIRFADQLTAAGVDIVADASWLLRFEGEPLRYPEKGAPGGEFLRAHAERAQAN